MKTNEEIISELQGIDGLDTAAGLKTLANMHKAYFRVLNTFIKMERGDKGKFEEFLANDDLEGFKISVHGYKSALANLGAAGLSEQAKELEIAARSGERAVIDDKLPAFITGIAKFADKLKAVLEE